MNSAWAIWWELFGWRFWRDVGAEVVLQSAPIDAALDCADAEALIAQMWRIQRVARWMPRSRCLDRAVTLIRWARRNNIAAELCIGVRHVEGQIRAHAWVESAGKVIDPEPEAAKSFQRLQGATVPEHFDA